MAMSIPTIPTDNLYKFCALSGLLLFGFSLVYPMLKLSEAELQVIDIQEQNELLSVDYKRTDRVIAQVEKDLHSAEAQKNQLEADLSKNPKNPSNLQQGNELTQALVLLRTKQSALRDLHDDNSRAQIKINAAERKLKYALVEIRRFTGAMIIGAALGAGLCWFGFKNWYSKIQSPQDQLLHQQLAEGTHAQKRADRHSDATSQGT
jgi:hypothetical protein